MLSFNANPPRGTFVIQFPPHINFFLPFFSLVFFLLPLLKMAGKIHHIFFFSRSVLSQEEKADTKRETRGNLMQFASEIKNTLSK